MITRIAAIVLLLAFMVYAIRAQYLYDQERDTIETKTLEAARQAIKIAEAYRDSLRICRGDSLDLKMR